MTEARQTCCDGNRETFVDWLRKVLRISPYLYYVSEQKRVHKEPVQHTDTIVREDGEPERHRHTEQVAQVLPYYTVSRGTKNAPFDSYRRCFCGKWSPWGSENFTPGADQVFFSAREADAFARRANYGIPDRWELIITGLAISANILAVFAPNPF